MAFHIKLALGKIHFHKAPKPAKEKESSCSMAALRVVLPRDLEPQGCVSHVPSLSQEWHSRADPAHTLGTFPGERDGPGWDRTSLRGVVRSAVLPGWDVAVVQLEWQLWDSPAPSQAPTVTVLQRTRAQLVPSLKGIYLKIRVQNVELPSFLLPWVSFKCVPQFLHL